MKTAAILARAGRQLQDNGTRWAADALLDYANVGIRRIMALLPGRFAQVDTMELALSVEQEIPDCLLFVGPTRNMGADGTTPGAAIYPVDQRTLTAYQPNWRSATGETVQEWMPDSDDRFLVHPAPASTLHIEYLAVPMPTAITNGADEDVPLPDRYEMALIHLILSAAFAEDTETGSAPFAQMHSNSFMAQLGLEVSSGAD